ncbi:MAG: DUF559 domain-containing protein [Polyangiaceae bacterium]|nr:DUF559 domain-containing protein [Myxococcales bacterium]MCB9588758.1 DUF559 domain-containing protein [Polyangiaceae bacterium]MCB9605316.1 DUF559 domain-containing protein [Polyangiaceae bacterium]
MRRAPTPSEARLWLALRGKRLGFTFRRQVVVGGQYIADFLARDVRLIVELDGPRHCATADARRDRDLARLGYRTLRFCSAAVHQDLVNVVRRILEELHGVEL